MIYLKEPNTNRIVKFQNEASIGVFFYNWIKCTQTEINTYELEQKIAQIKGVAASLILATYPTHKQLNILMSKDATLIEAMNLFILSIRTKSNELEADLELLSDPEKIKNFPINFE